MARLIQLADFDRPRGGSFIPMLTGVGKAARERGWQPEFAFFDSAASTPWIEELRREGFRVHLAPSGLRGRDRRLVAWVDAIAGRPGGAPVVAHTHFTGFDLAVAIAARRRDDLHAIWHLHGPLPAHPWHYARALIKQGLLGRAVAAILCPAQNIVDDALRRGAPRSRVHFFPSAIVPEAFPVATAEERRAARAALGIAPEAAVVLHFGWHWRMKGGELFLGTVAELARNRDRELVALERGGGDQYVQLADRLGLSHLVRVLEPVPDARVLHAAADVNLASSLSEGMAYAVLESLCVGTPVVASDIPGHTFLAERVAACRVARKDPSDLAAAVETTLARDPAVAVREAESSRAWIADHLSVEILARQLAEFYERVAAGDPGEPWSG